MLLCLHCISHKREGASVTKQFKKQILYLFNFLVKKKKRIHIIVFPFLV